jgi:protein-tyrosine phosphatase
MDHGKQVGSARQEYVVGRRENEFCWLLPQAEDDQADDQNLGGARRFQLLSDAVAASFEHNGNVFEVIDDNGREALSEILVDLDLVNSVPYEGCYRVVIDELIAGPTFLSSNQAITQSRIKALAKAEVRYIVTLATESELFSAREQLDANFDGLFNQHYFPIVDGKAPSADFMRLILDAIDRMVGARETLFLHCLGGRGRTGVVVGCFLARHGVGTGIGALNALTKLRMEHGLFEPSPETESQRQRVIHWKEGQ